MCRKILAVSTADANSGHLQVLGLLVTFLLLFASVIFSVLLRIPEQLLALVAEKIELVFKEGTLYEAGA